MATPSNHHRRPEVIDLTEDDDDDDQQHALPILPPSSTSKPPAYESPASNASIEPPAKRVRLTQGQHHAATIASATLFEYAKAAARQAAKEDPHVREAVLRQKVSSRDDPRTGIWGRTWGDASDGNTASQCAPRPRWPAGPTGGRGHLERAQRADHQLHEIIPRAVPHHTGTLMRPTVATTVADVSRLLMNRKSAHSHSPSSHDLLDLLRRRLLASRTSHRAPRELVLLPMVPPLPAGCPRTQQRPVRTNPCRPMVGLLSTKHLARLLYSAAITTPLSISRESQRQKEARRPKLSFRRHRPLAATRRSHKPPLLYLVLRQISRAHTRPNRLAVRIHS